MVFPSRHTSRTPNSVLGNSVTAPGASFPFAALFTDNGGTATDTHHHESRRSVCRV
jgi:hypothetical protein